MRQVGGAIGAALAGACCLGFAPVLAALGAAGAGFLIRDSILVPLFVAVLAFTLWSLWRSRARHGQAGPFWLGLGGAVVGFAALWFSGPLAYVGIAALVAAALWDVMALRRGTLAGEAAEP